MNFLPESLPVSRSNSLCSFNPGLYLQTIDSRSKLRRIKTFFYGKKRIKKSFQLKYL